MVKLTKKQKSELEALANMPDEEIDLSDIPERPIDWSKARIAPFYRPIWRDFILRLDQTALDCFKNGLADGHTLDEAINKALRAQMFRIRFPVRAQHAEMRIRRIQESPGQIEDLYEAHKQEIEILYGESIEKVASTNVPLLPMSQTKGTGRHAVKDIRLKLDENVVDWFEYRLDDGQSLDEVLNQALIDHITWVNSPKETTQEVSAESTLESA